MLAKIGKIFAYLLILVFVVVVLFFISYLVFEFKVLSLIGLEAFFAKNLAYVSFLFLAIFAFSNLVLAIKRFLVKVYYYVPAQLSEDILRKNKHIDFIFSFILLLPFLVNVKYFYMFFNFTKPYQDLAQFIANNVFIINVFLTLILYLLLLFVYVLINIVFFSHKSYHVRVLPKMIIAHKPSPGISIIFLVTSFLAFLLFFGLFSVEIVFSKSEMFLKILFSLITLIYWISFSIVISTKVFFGGSTRNVYTFLVLFSIAVLVIPIFVGFDRINTKVSIFSVDSFRGRIFESLPSVKFRAVGVDDLNVSVNPDSIANLTNYNLVFVDSMSVEEGLEIVYNISIDGFEKLYYSFLSRIADLVFIDSFETNVVVNIQEKLGEVFWFSKVYKYSEGDKTLLEVIYNLDLKDFENFIVPFSVVADKTNVYLINSDVKVKEGIFSDSESIDIREFISYRDSYFLSSRFGNISFRKVKVFYKDNFSHVSLISKDLNFTITNGYYYIYTSSGHGDEFLVFPDVVLTLSDVDFYGKKVGIKVEYMGISGFGGDFKEALLNLLGNVIYYQRVLNLTRTIEYVRDNISKLEQSLVSNKVMDSMLIISNIKSVLGY